MISNLKRFPYFWCLGAQRRLNVWRSSVYSVSDDLLCNRFCTATETINQQPKVTESPELPDWVRILKKEEAAVEQEDDDFLLPSFSEWVKNEKLRAREVDVKGLASETTENDVDKISKVLRFHFRSPDAVVDALNKCSFDASECLVEQILKRFSFEWIPSYGFFKWVKVQKGVTLSSDLYNLMVDNLGKSRKFDLMRELLDEMSQLQGYVSLTTMSKIMRRFAKAGKYEDAIGAFARMEEFGVKKDTSAMNQLLDSLVKGGSVEHAHKVYLDFKDHIVPSVQTYNILVHGWCRARKIDEANETVTDMEEHGFSPDVVTYTCFIEAYCREKDFCKVDSIFRDMQMKGCSPSVVTYTITMKALGHAKEVNKALDVYEKMKQNGCVPDNSFYSSLIHMLGASGRVKDSYDIFEDMPKQGVSPDTFTYNTMITIAAHNSKEEDALKFLQKMEENQCKPDICTYAPLFKMCCRMRRLKVLSFLLNHMFKNDVSMDLGTYALLVRGLCRNRNPERACAVFELAVLRGFLPTDIMYDNLVKELEKRGLKEAKKRVEELMLQAKQRASDISSERPLKIEE
ncbi:pentatricopeptide repeat-containing protein At3g22670, mitochondrial [Lycium barbarum]|uniref:pentatricopeptide repeat-containing protein At3g22670, mitochondrial n=1 Tax=Lycium barbarum TaxID=112863 RepID=UPI00293F4F67|nr:pentatricopeptide repeat-containing protein At3g22670, mitochondrial [Lycium barbarum]